MRLSETPLAAIDTRDSLVRRMVIAFLFLMATVVMGTIGYHYLGQGQWSFFDCFYMAVVTLSTVGFAETLPGMNALPGARIFTVVLIVLGSGTLLYFVSTFTAFVVEGDLVGTLKRNRMQKRIDKLTDHVVVCGVGSTGIHIIEEFLATQGAFVAVDVDADRLEHLARELKGHELLHVVGDATDDHVLEQAGVHRARGVIAALHDDKDNLFVTVTARALNSKARIVAKAVEASADPKLRRAGADAVVSPNRIGGMRLVSEMVRPQVVQFLDMMLRDKQSNHRIEELLIPDTSPLVGAQLKDTDIRKASDVNVIAMRRPNGTFLYKVGPSTHIGAGDILVVLGETAQIAKLRDGIATGGVGRTR